MDLIRYSHSCVRIERAGRALVIDPGIWSEPRALLGADAVLVTHEHADHIDVLRLAGLRVPIYAPAGADIPRVDVIEVQPGQTFTAAGFTVTAVGGRHAPVRPGQVTCPNLGYMVEGTVYHPGDALHVPTGPVDTVLVPMQASWLKTTEVIDFIQAIAPRLALGIHDAQINDRGRASINGWLDRHAGTDYRWLPPQSSLVVDPDPD